jgi:hypothetical protein
MANIWPIVSATDDDDDRDDDDDDDDDARGRVSGLIDRETELFGENLAER